MWFVVLSESITLFTSSLSRLLSSPGSDTFSKAFLISLVLFIFVNAFLGTIEGALAEGVRTGVRVRPAGLLLEGCPRRVDEPGLCF